MAAEVSKRERIELNLNLAPAGAPAPAQPGSKPAAPAKTGAKGGA